METSNRPWLHGSSSCGRILTASWPPCGVSYFETKSSPKYCPPWPGSLLPSLVATALFTGLRSERPLSQAEGGFDIRWKGRWGSGGGPAICQEHPATVSSPADPYDRVRAVFLAASNSPGRPSKDRMQAVSMAHTVSGPGSGQGHLQPAGRRQSRWSGHWPNWMGPGPRSGP